MFRGNGCCGSLFTLSRVDSKYLYEARTFTPLCSSYVIERNAVSPPTGCLFFFLSFSESFSSTFLHRRTFHRSFLLLYLLPWNVTRERMERVISIANFHLWEPIIRKRIGNINRNVYSNKKKKKRNNNSIYSARAVEIF